MLSEQELVRAIRKVLSGDAPGVVIPVGDDAAVVEAGRHHQVLATDVLVEGVHFEVGSTSPSDLGYKAIAVNVSDVAAMGGSPRFALVALVLPEEVEPSWVMELVGGIREASEEYGMQVVGGDTSRGGVRAISIAVSGAVAKGRAVTRSGGRAGDALVVTGRLGAAAGGLRLASAPPHGIREALASDWGRELVHAYARPVARVGEGETLAHAGATAMIDVSDGLAIDLARVCEESGVGARVELAGLPVAEGLELLAEGMAIDPMDLALNGGEDYELLAAIPAEVVVSTAEKIRERYGTALTRIGELTEGTGLISVGPDGRESHLAPKGWNHFA